MACRRTDLHRSEVGRNSAPHPDGNSSVTQSRPSAASGGLGSSTGECSSEAAHRLDAIDAEIRELQAAQAAVLKAKERRDALLEAEWCRDSAVLEQRQVEARAHAAENVRGRSQGVRADFLPPHKRDMVGAGGGRLGQHAEQRAVSERWGVSPLWGGGHTQHRERAQRRREEMVRRCHACLWGSMCTMEQGRGTAGAARAILECAGNAVRTGREG
mmetsp:Transcript_43423/g.108849  ORF Transcript_43423/g.108849 Transcript_43423/m.108849 type:complete len:215 (-) Transcript_43423:316-960(-)